MKDIAEITAEIEIHKADRAEILNDYPDLHEWETADGEMASWINHE